MLDALIRLSLKNRTLVTGITALILVYGWLVAKNLPVDVFPDLNRPTVTVLTDGHGMAPEEVEVVLTRPIENALNGIPGVTRLYSTSNAGLSVVRAEFAWQSDVKMARLEVSERLQLVRDRLPKESAPLLSPTSSILGEIQLIGLQGEDLTALRTWADWTLKPRLLTLAGVAQVTVLGGNPYQAQVLVNADLLRKKQIGLLDLKERISRISESSSGGFLETPDGEREHLIRNVGRILNPNEIETSAVGMHFGIPVQLKDVAKVELAPAPKRGEASINAEPGIVLMVSKQTGSDTLKISQAIERTLKDLKPSLPPGAKIEPALFRQSDFIHTAIENVIEALRDGSVMVTLVLVLFLLNFRTTAITLTAIPISLLITALVFRLFGIGINTMTLGGLAIALGELVDDAVVDVENVFRRLRENRARPKPRPTLEVVFEASSEIRNSIVLSTIIVVLVFIPLFALSGVEGRLFAPIGLAYSISLVASLLVSLTLTPVLCSWLLPKQAERQEKDSWLAEKLKAWETRLLEKTLEHPRQILAGTALLFILSLAALPWLGGSFLPSFNEGSAMLEVDLRAGTSLSASSKLASKVERSLLEVPEVASVGRRTGRAEDDAHASGVNHSEFEVRLKTDGRPRAQVVEDFRNRMAAILPKDAYYSVSQPITHRLDHVLSGVKSQVAFKLFGPDLRVLRQQTAEILSILRDVPGIADLRADSQALYPQYKIYAVREDLSKLGVSPGDLIESLEAMLQGVPVTRIIEKDRSMEVFLRLDPASRKNIEAIRSLPVHVLPTGRVVKLEEIADIFETSGPTSIERENLQRRVAIAFNTQGRDMASVVADAESRIREKVVLPAGYFLEIGGQHQSRSEAGKQLFWLGSTSLLAVFLVLYTHFSSARLALQVMINIPLALIGAVFAIALTDRTVSIATLIAFITLCGIASRNGILLITHYLHLIRKEGQKLSRELIIRGTVERLVPVLMTALSAILALSPLLFAKDQPGKEILHPVAVVIIGGLISSTLLDIFVTPVIFYWYGRKHLK